MIDDHRATVASLVLETLSREAGCRAVFGISGGPIVPLFCAFGAAGLSYVQTSSEREAAYMARGYYAHCGRPAIVVATTGASLDVLEPAVGAIESREPFLLLTAITPVALAGYGCLQEVNTIGIFQSAGIQGKAVYAPENVLHSVREALQAVVWHRRPYVLAFPKDVLMAPRPTRTWDCDGFLPDAQGAVDRGRLAAFADALATSRRPLLILGREAVRDANQQAAVCEVATRFRIPVATTQRGKGSVPETGFPWSVGSIGSGSHPVAQFLTFDPKTPVGGTFVVGSQLGQLATNSFRDLAASAPADGISAIVDDPRALCKYPIDHGIIARDPASALQLLVGKLAASDKGGRSEWSLAELEALRAKLGDSHDEPTSRIATILRAFSTAVGPGVKFFVGSGEHNLHFTQHVRITEPRGYNYDAFGMMGAELASALGCAVAQTIDRTKSGDDARFRTAAAGPADRLIAVVTGDGCLTRSLGSLATLAHGQLPIFVLVLNNGGAGQVRWVHENLHSGRPDVYDVSFLDYAAAAMGLGLRARRIGGARDLVAAWSEFREDRRPTICQLDLERSEHPDRAMRVRRRIAESE